jgi:CxxC motif-containing protein (DUF1111 family)
MRRFSLLTVAVWVAAATWALLPGNVFTQGFTEAPTGFDNVTNGFVNQATFDATKATFAEQESISDGLGPVYNAQSCGECHQNPVTGAISQVTEHRMGRFKAGVFSDVPGGSLLHSRATHAAIQEQMADTANVESFRTSLNTLGDGFVEAIDDSTLQAIAYEQSLMTSGKIAGQVVMVPVFEAGNAMRAGRFGWKDQQASLESFSADAYLNEMGITSALLPTENTSNGRFVGFGTRFDPVPEPEDVGGDVQQFAAFMRATKAPARARRIAATVDAQRGEQVFNDIGCNICHRPSIVTAPAGTVINGGTFTVPEALGSKVIHPFGDFLLHDINTGDGIVQNGGPTTRNKVRTAPLWGLRTHNRLMHDGLSFTLADAIMRHRGEASRVENRFELLSKQDSNALLTFLSSL